MGHQAWRQIRHAALVAALHGVVKGDGAPAEALFDHAKILAQQRLQDHRPALVLAVARPDRIGAVSVGIAKAEYAPFIHAISSIPG